VLNKVVSAAFLVSVRRELPTNTTWRCVFQTSRVTNFGSTTKRFDTISSGAPHSRETLESQLERDMRAQQAERQQQAHSSKKRQQPKPSSMFASSTNRPHQMQKATGPSPGDYEVCPSSPFTHLAAC
jgi:hypothetical protein